MRRLISALISAVLIICVPIVLPSCADVTVVAEAKSTKGLDCSYKSKFAHINNPDVPNYGYGDPLEKFFYSEKYHKKAMSHNKTKTKGGFDYRKFKSGVEIASVPWKNTLKIPAKIGGKPVIKLGGKITVYEDGGLCYRESTWECGAHKVVISRNVREIVAGTFSDMEELRRIEVSKDNPYFSSENGILYNKDKSVLLFVPMQHPAAKISIHKGTKKVYSLFSEKTHTVNIPASVEKIKGGNKNKVYNAEVLDWLELGGINVDKANKNYSSEDGVLYNKKKTEMYLYPYMKDEKKFTVPDSVKTIDYMYLDHIESLKEIDFGKNIQKIGFTGHPALGLFDRKITVKGYKNTAAKRWAKKYDFKFVAVG